MNAKIEVARWIRVNRSSPCQVCHKPDWCTVTTDGTVAGCMRVESPRQLRNGGWLHRLGHPDTRSFVEDRYPLVPASTRASTAVCDCAYRALGDLIGLSPRHHDHLLRDRGLPPAAIERFTSSPPDDPEQRRRLAREIIERVGDTDALRGVPGFHQDGLGRWTCRWTPSGFLVPVEDAQGHAQAFQVRVDSPTRDGSRYIWWSSRNRPGGASSEAPVGISRADLLGCGPVWFTEGSLKATVAAWYLPACVIGVPGVSNWRRALPLIPERSSVVIAFDTDAATNPAVARHREGLARALYWTHHIVTIALWDSAYKGIDDALLAGATIDQRPWPASARQ